MARLHRDGNREQVWRRHLEQQHSSGLTARACCRANALRESAFFFWKKEVAKRDRESTARPNPTSAFVPIVAPINRLSSRAARVKIGEETSEQLDFRPAKLFVWEHVRLVRLPEVPENKLRNACRVE